MNQDPEYATDTLTRLTDLLDGYRQEFGGQEDAVETLKTLLWKTKDLRAKLNAVLVKCDTRRSPKVLYVCIVCGGFTVDARDDGCCVCDWGYIKYDVLPHGSALALRALTTYWRNNTPCADAERMRLLRHRVTYALDIVELRKSKSRERRRGYKRNR